MGSNDTPSQSNGYSYHECLVEQLPDRLECKICRHSLCRNTRLSQCCGHVYCTSCLEMWMSSGNWDRACPMCRKEGLETIVHHEANRIINQLLVRCPCREIGRGCKWSGKLCDLDNHVKECKVECERCGVELNYYLMFEHKATISYACKNCHSKEHCNCHTITIACPNICGVDNIPQGDINEHKRMCLLEMIQCAHDKCEEQIAQKDIEQHNNDKGIQHLQVMVTQTKEEASRGIRVTIKKFDDVILESDKILDYIVKSVKWLCMMLFFISIIILVTALICSVIIGDNIGELKSMQENGLQYQFSTLQNLYLQLSREIDGASESIQSSIKDEILHKPLQVPDPEFDISAVILRMPNFIQRITNKEFWESNPFFAFAGGYQMCLQVHVKEQDLSVYLNLMKGPHDDELQESGYWPLRGIFIIELLNQNSDTNHYRRTLEFSESVARSVSSEY